MRFILCVFTILLLFVVRPAFSQNPYLARLSIYGNIGELGISPNEEVWVATAAGQVYYRSRTDDVFSQNEIHGQLHDYYQSVKFERFISD